MNFTFRNDVTTYFYNLEGENVTYRGKMYIYIPLFSRYLKYLTPKHTIQNVVDLIWIKNEVHKLNR